jgi:hypothetical protein
MRTRRLYLMPLVVAALCLSAAPVQADLTGTGTVRPIPNGTITSGPDAVTEPGTARVTVVARGTDNQLWRVHSLDNGNSWGGWGPLPQLAGGVVGEPAVVSWEAGRIDVFVRGTDDKLWQTTRFDLFGDFQPWIRPVGTDGVLASSPGVTVRGPGRLDVFVLGTDGLIYQRFWAGNSWNSGWLAQGEPAGEFGLVGDPSPVWSAPIAAERLDLFARGTDDKLWWKFWNGSVWSEWARPVGQAGTLASSPETTRFTDGSGDFIALFVRGTDGGLYGIDFRPSGAGNWVRLGGPNDVIVDSPGATFAANALQIFGRSPANVVLQYTLVVPRVAG